MLETSDTCERSSTKLRPRAMPAIFSTTCSRIIGASFWPMLGTTTLATRWPPGWENWTKSCGASFIAMDVAV